VINPRWLELQCPTNHIDRRAGVSLILHFNEIPSKQKFIICFLSSHHCTGLTVEEFIQQYEIPGKPVIITDAMKHWPANKNWTLPVLLQKYAQVKVS
jgi:hypothetical protein